MEEMKMNKKTANAQTIQTNNNIGGTIMRIKPEDLKLNGKEIFEKFGMLSNEAENPGPPSPTHPPGPRFD